MNRLFEISIKPKKKKPVSFYLRPIYYFFNFKKNVNICFECEVP